MPKFKRLTLVSAVVLISLIFYGWVGLSQSTASVQLTTNPPVSQILPFEAEATNPQYPVSLNLKALDSTGKALEKAKISLQIFTPSKTPWMTTDFPIVEGTELLAIEAVAPKGELDLQQMLPIRGNYKLIANVTPLEEKAFSPIQQTLSISVPENGVKYRNFGILAAILLAVGLGGGLVIGGKQHIQPGEIVPNRVRLLLSGGIVVAIAALLFINISSEIAQSEMPMSHHSHSASTTNLRAIQSQGLEAKLIGDIEATVGKSANLGVEVIDTKTGQPVTDINLSIKTTQLENSWTSFAYQGTPDNTGKLTWKQQFFDGAPHKVEVEISPQGAGLRQFSPFQITEEISVEGVAPPLFIRLITLVYFTGIVGLGLLLGLKLKTNLNLLQKN